MIKCPFCGRYNSDGAIICVFCHEKMVDDISTDKPEREELLSYDLELTHGEYIQCPYCGSRDMQVLNEPINNVVTTGGGYSFLRGALGWMLFGNMGTLLGLGKRQKTKVYSNNRTFWVCSHCGKKSRNLCDWLSEIRSKEHSIKTSAVITGIFVLGLLALLSGGSRIISLILMIYLVFRGLRLLNQWFELSQDKKSYKSLLERSGRR